MRQPIEEVSRKLLSVENVWGLVVWRVLWSSLTALQARGLVQAAPSWGAQEPIVQQTNRKRSLWNREGGDSAQCVLSLCVIIACVPLLLLLHTCTSPCCHHHKRALSGCAPHPDRKLSAFPRTVVPRWFSMPELLKCWARVPHADLGCTTVPPCPAELHLFICSCFFLPLYFSEHLPHVLAWDLWLFNKIKAMKSSISY